MISDLIEKNEKIPTLFETNTLPYGPEMNARRKVFLKFFILLWTIGLIPSLINWFTSLDVPPVLTATGLGFLIPGGGFLALGTVHGIIVGLLIFGAFYLAGLETYFLFGDFILPTALWLLGASGGLLAGKNPPLWEPLGPLVTIGFTAVVTCYFSLRVRGIISFLKNSRRKRLATFEESINRVESKLSREIESDERELSEESVRASRYLYDLCLSGQGWRYFDRMYLPSLAGLYYQFSYVGYQFMTLQCKYMPNFHGYLSEAQRFLIESYTKPRICQYWKWLSLAGYQTWNPDPAKHGNVMLTGWAFALIAGYEANTGDLRYSEPGALKFKPWYHFDKTYDHSTTEIIESFEHQFATEPSTLIPCEPRLQFPVCNSYAMAAMLVYDRFHHTNHTEKIYDKFIRALSEEFVEMNGDVAMKRYQLTGMRIDRMMNPIGSTFGNVAIAQAYNPIYPGLAKRSYAFVRDEMLEIRDGVACLKGIDWNKMLDMGTQTYNPGGVIAMLLINALEFGDYEMAEALRNTEKKFLVPSKLRFKYKGVSVVGMATLAAARWSRKDEWKDTILKGPPAAAYTGPLLADCSYPGVLVAKAFSHGKDLEMVLYNGTEKKEQKLSLERLDKDRFYLVRETGQKIHADSQGKAVLDCMLDGRTPVTLIPA
jgi:hypothetical protein